MGQRGRIAHIGLQNAFRLNETELALEILRLLTVRQIEAFREECVNIDIIPPNEVFETVAQSGLGGDKVVPSVVVDDLKLLQFGYDIGLFDGELQVEHGRMFVRVLEPAPL